MTLTLVMVDSKFEPIPMNRFMQDLVRDSSRKGESVNEGSAKSVFDFDRDVDGTRNGNGHGTTSTATPCTATRGLVLVSDNARVFAKARPKQNANLLTSASWHSSSEIRKMYTANTRWGSKNTSISPPMGSSRNKLFHPDRAAAARKQEGFGPPMQQSDPCLIVAKKRLSVPRKQTSDSCLVVPKRSWMQRPQEAQEIPVRAALVVSRFSASSVETALAARRSRDFFQRQRSSEEEDIDDDSSNSFSSFASSDKKLLNLATAVVHSSPTLSDQDRAAYAISHRRKTGTSSSSRSPPRPVRRKTGKSASRTKNKTNFPKRSSSCSTLADGCSSDRDSFREQQKRLAPPPLDRFAPIPPSLLQFKHVATPSRGCRRSYSAANATRISPRSSPSSLSVCLEERTGRKGSGLGSGGKSSQKSGIYSRGSKNLSSDNLSRSRSGGKSSQKSGIYSRGSKNLSSDNLSRSSSGGKSSRKSGIYSRSSNNIRSNSSNNISSNNDDNMNNSSFSSLELALGDMAPKRRSGRRPVGRTKSSRN